jgi:hypothetical protein
MVSTGFEKEVDVVVEGLVRDRNSYAETGVGLEKWLRRYSKKSDSVSFLSKVHGLTLPGEVDTNDSSPTIKEGTDVNVTSESAKLGVPPPKLDEHTDALSSKSLTSPSRSRSSPSTLHPSRIPNPPSPLNPPCPFNPSLKHPLE